MTQSNTWLVTGASSGLGRALTEKALQHGDRVAATVRDPSTLDDLARRHGARLWIARLDVTDPRAVREVIGRAFRDFGRIDVVVNNAGFGLFGAAEELSDEQIRLQIATNLLGSIDVIRAALPALREQGGGRIVQISSEGGQFAYPNFSAYHASKWGIEGFVESVALEVASFGIDCTIVEPGPTATNFRSSVVRAEAMSVYAGTPSGEMRRAIDDGSFVLKGDAGKTASAIYDAALRRPAPKRVVLGSDAYTHLHAAYTERLAALEAQREIALSADA